jgi:hypothetical protein
MATMPRLDPILWLPKYIINYVCMYTQSPRWTLYHYLYHFRFLCLLTWKQVPVSSIQDHLLRSSFQSQHWQKQGDRIARNFSPIGWLSTMGSYSKITEESHFFEQLFPRLSLRMHSFWQKNGWAIFWVIFSQTHLVTLGKSHLVWRQKTLVRVSAKILDVYSFPDRFLSKFCLLLLCMYCVYRKNV